MRAQQRMQLLLKSLGCEQFPDRDLKLKIDEFTSNIGRFRQRAIRWERRKQEDRYFPREITDMCDL